MGIIQYLLTQVTVIIIPFGGEIPYYPGHYCTFEQGEISGMYYNVTNELFVCADKKGGTGTTNGHMTIKHKLGHYVWFNILTEKERKQYEIEWIKSMSLEGQFNREYSKKNVLEGFADDFMYLNDDGYQSYTKDIKQRNKRIVIVKRSITKIKNSINKKENQ